MGSHSHQAAEDLERIEPVLSLEGRLESSPRPRTRKKQCYDGLEFFSPPKNNETNKKRVFCFEKQNASGFPFWMWIDILIKGGPESIFFGIYKPFPPPRLTQNASSHILPSRYE